MRLFVLHRPPPGEIYEGMDRPLLRVSDGVSDELIYREVALEDIPILERLPALQRLLSDLSRAGENNYELVALDEPPGPEWQLSGYDVGELGTRRWSAIAHETDFLSGQELAEWRHARNDHGLFPDVEVAGQFLKRYLKYEDPDRGWGPDGWTDSLEGYGVVSVYRCEKNWG